MPDLATTIIRLKRLKNQLPLLLTNDAANHFKGSFRRQRLDSFSPRWKGRANDVDSGRAVLVKSSRLVNSIRRISVNKYGGTVGTDVTYASIHNKGGSVNAIQTVGRHTRKEHTRRRKGRTERVAAHTVSAHSRKVNFTMPKRQFMGKSKGLELKWKRTFRKELRKALL